MPPEYKECVESIREQARNAFDMPSLGAVALTVKVRRPAPKRLITVEPDTHRPDLDNLVGTVMDALTGVAWADDCQVVSIQAHKLPRLPDRGWWTKIEVTAL